MDPLIGPRCDFRMRLLSCIEDPPVVRKILDPLGLWDAQQRPPPAEHPAGGADLTAEASCRGWLKIYPYDETGWLSEACTQIHVW
jgi:hypothetical protein